MNDQAMQEAFVADQGARPAAVLFMLTVPDSYRTMSRDEILSALRLQALEILDELAATVHQQLRQPVDVAGLHRNMGEALRGIPSAGGHGG